MSTPATTPPRRPAPAGETPQQWAARVTATHGPMPEHVALAARRILHRPKATTSRPGP